ncbi:ImmA/IrrE family metallo-endopeptidase [Sphingobacterium sp. lm-10]|uniref:ImmA/IrrE family metallo-endopeptidase n=1 Tax=Sphingobacterium sp. lm-10 TaxID=2944904 RepID=UPI0020202D3B|nr:ImmA/IrrE family metallo-endopeptidase [Sphingobacterium sp. lm-10]MCL7989212.1 ImmA/IrrE family metallo-endopeptidase [Sphingobacterium sp. lm-10]
MTVEELAALISKGKKKAVDKEDIYAGNIDLAYLKRIDKIFNKGLHYYLDPTSPNVEADASIFFRKHKFDVDLNFGAKKVVNQFEEFKISLSGIAKLADLKIHRILPIFKIENDAQNSAFEIRKILYPDFQNQPKEFLKSFISKLAEYNILVFEFVETWNKKEKANIDGFFLTPNVIVLKRQQVSFRREIFTLSHELGHYLLNKEEIEKLDVQDLSNKNLSKVERWCNDFAYHFLAGPENPIETIDAADPKNDYAFDIVENVSANTHLSKIALFTRLLYKKKISIKHYNMIKADFEEQFRQRQEEEKSKKEQDKLDGIKIRGSAPKPINSPLLISTIQTAFYEGVINEYDVCKTLNIKPDKLETILS